MTQFVQLEILYNQYSNLLNEITNLINDEDFDSVLAKLQYKNDLIRKLANAKNTTKLTDEQAQKIILIEQQLQEKEHSNIKLLSKLHDEIGKMLKDTNKKVKINSVYNVMNKNQTGFLCDLSE